MIGLYKSPPSSLSLIINLGFRRYSKSAPNFVWFTRLFLFRIFIENFTLKFGIYICKGVAQGAKIK